MIRSAPGISLALGQGAKTLVGVAGVGSGNDCLIVPHYFTPLI